jgi:hydrogenase maturation protease
MATNKTLILGVGNPLRRDDGIGPLIVGKLDQEELKNVDIQDGGTDGLGLIEYLKEYPRAIIIDAVEMNLEPGAIRSFKLEEVKVNIKADTLSTHGFGLAEVFELMKSLNIETEVKVIGVQPESIEFGEGLSQEVLLKVSKIIEIIKKNT